MKNRSKALFVIVIFFASFSALAGTYQPTAEGGDSLPWPWGSECPFPWHNIEGMWTESEPKTEDLPVSFFEFEIIDYWSNGTRVFRVTQYSESGDVLAVGRGTAPRGQKIVRAVLLPSRPGHVSFSAIVRAYTEDRFVCSDKLVTVLTMRKRGATPSEDVHLIIGKTQKVSID